MIYFLHIPKTGGQSFRQAAIKYFGKENCLLLYGEDAKTTSVDANFIYYKLPKLSPEQKYKNLCKHIIENNIDFFSSHASATRLPCFNNNEAAIFLRDPIHRIISHYNYGIKKKHIDGTFESFIENPLYQNMQSALLCEQPISSLGFVGINEHYKESLALFNHTYDTSLKYYHKNKLTVFSKCIKEKDISSRLIEKIKKLNRRDLELYEEGKNIFHQRIRTLSNV